MRVWLPLAALSLSVAAFGCFTPTSTIPDSSDNGGNVGGCSTCNHHTGAGASGGNASGGAASSGSSTSGGNPGGSSGAGSTSSGGSSGGGSTGSAVVCGASGGGTGGTNMIFDCNNVPYYMGTAGSCTADWLGSEVIDFDSCSPICGAQVAAVDPNGVPIAGTSQFSDPATGVFHFCLPPTTTFETQVTAPGYGLFTYGEIQGQLGQNLPQFGMLTTDTVKAFSSLIQGQGGLNTTTDGALVVFSFNTDGCGDANWGAGWVISLTDESGAAYPDGGYGTLYINAEGIPAPGPSTTNYGVAILYNIDPSVAAFPTLHATSTTGNACVVVNQELGFTGRVQVGPGIFSEQGIFLE